MHHVGIDLAWGERSPSGVAVLDDRAQLVHVSTHVHEDDVVAAVEPWIADECLVGIDAPLVVRNATGTRGAERELNADFRRFEAGAHPTNLGKVEMIGGSRGLRVCGRLGLAVDPEPGPPRRAIEVYPHAATIALFDLPRTLKYKAKQGRDLDLLRSELLRLMDLVATVVTTDDDWDALRRHVEQAERKSHLRVVEDQVDAVLCAYVAWFAHHHPDRTTTYGDRVDGFIVTPTLVEPTDVDRRS